MKLISMTDFVIEQNSKEHSLECLLKIRSYAKFLKQPLTLGMFVPAKLVNDEWVVLEKPDCSFEDMTIGEHVQLIEYQETKERVLFEEFEIVDLYDGVKRLASPCGSYNLFWYSEEKGWYFSRGVDGQTVEYLAKEKLDLTQSTIKQIGL